MSAKEQLHELVERLPEAGIEDALSYLESLVDGEEPPVSPEMLAQIAAARANPTMIPHEEILREFLG